MAGEDSMKQRHFWKKLRIGNGSDSSHLIIQNHPILKFLLRRDMNIFIKETLREKGEGVILRQPLSPYEQGSSKSVLKFKILRDEEALIIGIKGLAAYYSRGGRGLLEYYHGSHIKAIGETLS